MSKVIMSPIISNYGIFSGEEKKINNTVSQNVLDAGLKNVDHTVKK